MPRLSAREHELLAAAERARAGRTASQFLSWARGFVMPEPDDARPTGKEFRRRLQALIEERP